MLLQSGNGSCPHLTKPAMYFPIWSPKQLLDTVPGTGKAVVGKTEHTLSSFRNHVIYKEWKFFSSCPPAYLISPNPNPLCYPLGVCPIFEFSGLHPSLLCKKAQCVFLTWKGVGLQVIEIAPGLALSTQKYIIKK